MAAAESVVIRRREIDQFKLGKVPLPAGVSRPVFESVAMMMLTVTGDEGNWHGQMSALLANPSLLDQETTRLKRPTGAIKGFLAEQYTYPIADDILESFKGELRDAIAWDGAHVISPTGTITGINRKLNAPRCPCQLQGGFGTKHNSALAFAYKFPAVVIVRSDDQEKGITILSHAALRGSTPHAYKLVAASKGGGGGGNYEHSFTKFVGTWTLKPKYNVGMELWLENGNRFASFTNQNGSVFTPEVSHGLTNT